ncbi:MAG: transglycosylase SLT domain-containing protein [Saccharospirillaceae bacterium]|nr:transglycosylase SLT domain-containing protein [Pseudomonadales bacterium]NRB78916.1 transglycosylase SLT domain-containing protein [Saccharospirillaceae bacterium]
MKLSIKSTILAMFILFSTQYASADAFKKYKQHDKYDRYFKKYSKRFFGAGFDWQLFKAQAIAESNLRPDAKSYVGAQGLMQIMPRTYQEIIGKNKFIEGAATEPKSSIAAGIYYDRQKWNIWKSDRPLLDRLKFMFASYNAGAQNIINAQKKAKEKTGLEANTWQPVADNLKAITGDHSIETINYVDKIFIILEDIN